MSNAGRQIFIGDIHGCSEELKKLLDALHLDPSDQIYFVGDLINRGPHSREVIEIVASLGEQAQVVLGNHELGFLRGRDLPHFQKLNDEIGDWISWLEAKPLYIENKNWILVHAGIPPGRKPLAKISPEILTRIRTWDGVGLELNNIQNPAWWQLYDGIKPVIYGHWAIQGLNLRLKTYGIDSGCVWGRQLSALIWDTKKVISVHATRAYCQFK